MALTTTLTPGGVRCKHCPAVYRGDETSARVAGWRIWRGQTVGGKQREDVVCSACAGTAAPLDADGESDSKAGWRVRCNTCDWDTVEYDDDGEGPMTAKQAKDQAHWHQCEPEVQIAPPDGDDWYHPHRITDEGVLRG